MTSHVMLRNALAWCSSTMSAQPCLSTEPFTYSIIENFPTYSASPRIGNISLGLSVANSEVDIRRRPILDFAEFPPPFLLSKIRCGSRRRGSDMSVCLERIIVSTALMLFWSAGTAHAQVASVYGGRDGHCGTRTANGERLNCAAMTAAHRKLPFGTRVRVCHSGCVIVRINDRGPLGSGSGY
jgi:peptidoglycan lytic transglycosylase